MKTILNKILPMDATERKGVPDPAARDPAGPRAAPHVIDSSALFRTSPEILIRHNGRDYRLRLTRLGKLILTA